MPPAAEVPHDTWWLVFDDPALDEVVAEAQRSNPSVRVAGSRIMEARAQLGIAGSALYPQLQQLSAQAFRVGQDTSDVPSQSYNSYGAAFDIAWEMDFWGKFRRGIEASDAAYFASVAARRAGRRFTATADIVHSAGWGSPCGWPRYTQAMKIW